MSRIEPDEGIIANLRKEIRKGRREYLEQSVILEILQDLSGQSFSSNVEAGVTWIRENGDKMGEFFVLLNKRRQK